MRRRRKTEEKESELARALLIAEYQRLSTEIYHAYETGQGIVRFTLAAYGAIFAAGLLAARGSLEGGVLQGFDPSAVMVVFGIVLPALMCVCCWTWIGELNRAERAGVYVFRLEQRLAAEPSLANAIAGQSPLGWETHLREASTKKAPARKRVSPYLGTAMLFAGGAITSFIFAMLWWAQVWDWDTRPVGTIWWIVGPAALIVVFLVSSAIMGFQLLRLGKVGIVPTASEV